MPDVQTRLIADDGRDVSNVPNTMGEIQVKTTSLFKEYVSFPFDIAMETVLMLITDTGENQEQPKKNTLLMAGSKLEI